MKRVVTLGVPGLGIIKEIYDFDDPASREALDRNIANGCLLLKHAEAPRNEIAQNE